MLTRFLGRTLNLFSFCNLQDDNKKTFHEFFFTEFDTRKGPQICKPLGRIPQKGLASVNFVPAWSLVVYHSIFH